MSSSATRKSFANPLMATPQDHDPYQRSSLLSLKASANCNATSDDPIMLRITQAEHDVLVELARRYTNLRSNLITLGADLDVIERFSHEGSISPSNELVGDTVSFPSPFTTIPDHPTKQNMQRPDSIATFPDKPSSATRKQMSAKADVFYPSGLQNRVSKWMDHDGDDSGQHKKLVSNDEHHASHTPSNAELSAEDSARASVSRHARRTVRLDHLTVGTRLSDIEAAIRGGQILEMCQRYKEKAAIISFVHEHDAQAFYDHSRKHDLYIKAKRIEVSWNDFQKPISGQLAWSIRSGATRNFIVRQCDSYQTPEGIEDDLEHIHDLQVISVEIRGRDCFIKTNSISGAVFARTCMSSRQRCRMEWDVDECMEPLKGKSRKSRSGVSSPPSKPVRPVNRYEMLSVDRDA